MGYLDTLKKLNSQNRTKNTTISPAARANSVSEEKTALLQFAQHHVDPLDIKTDLLPKDYKPKIPKHIIQRNLEKQAQAMNARKKASSPGRTKEDSTGMRRDESDIVGRRLMEKFENKRSQRSKNQPKTSHEFEEKEPEKKLSFKEMMRLAEVNKNQPKVAAERKQASGKAPMKVVKPLATKRPGTTKPSAPRRTGTSAVSSSSQQQQLLKQSKQPKNVYQQTPRRKEKQQATVSSDEDHSDHKPSGFDLLMEEEMESERFAREEDLKEARLLKKRELEKQKRRQR